MYETERDKEASWLGGRSQAPLAAAYGVVQVTQISYEVGTELINTLVFLFLFFLSLTFHCL